MTRRVQARFTDVPDSAAMSLFGALGGQASVPFYYNRIANLNRDPVTGAIIQWADCIRGYTGPNTPPVLRPVGGPNTHITYDPVKGVVSDGTLGTALGTVLSGAFSLSAGSPGGGVTRQGLGTLWVVGEFDAPSLSALAVITNGGQTAQLALVTDPTAATYAANNETGPGANAVSSVAPDGTRRLLVLTSTTGLRHGIRVPNQAQVQNTGEQARASEPYVLFLFAQALSQTVNGAPGSIAEIGGLTREATAVDFALLAANAVSQHAASLA
jgi:hypothetical protein